MKISSGKQKGLQAVADKRGVIGAAAMDQRGSLQSAIAKEKGIDKVVFDRAGYKYHGRVSALADGAREAGLKF